METRTRHHHSKGSQVDRHGGRGLRHIVFGPYDTFKIKSVNVRTSTRENKTVRTEELENDGNVWQSCGG